MTRTLPSHTEISDIRTLHLVNFYENLNPNTLSDLSRIYADDVHFKDPFNTITGLAPLRRIFDHMLEALQDPRFKITQAITQGDQAFLLWDFTFSRKGLPSPMLIHGSTHLRYNAEGRVNWHRDYWDAAEELYCQLPVLGALFRWLQRQFAVPQSPTPIHPTAG